VASNSSSVGRADEMFSGAMFDFSRCPEGEGKKVEPSVCFSKTRSSAPIRRMSSASLRPSRFKLSPTSIQIKLTSLSVEVQQLKAADPDVLLPSCYTTDAIL